MRDYWYSLDLPNLARALELHMWFQVQRGNIRSAKDLRGVVRVIFSQHVEASRLCLSHHDGAECLQPFRASDCQSNQAPCRWPRWKQSICFFFYLKPTTIAVVQYSYITPLACHVNQRGVCLRPYRDLRVFSIFKEMVRTETHSLLWRHLHSQTSDKRLRPEIHLNLNKWIECPPKHESRSERR